MNKNIFYRLYSAVFVGVCLVPAVFSPFAKQDSSKEKRGLSEFPKIKTESGKLNFDFFTEFETYFSEHFAFRQYLVTADSRLKTALTSTSPNSDVIDGKDGWLFYGETVGDFLRTDTMTSLEISNIANTLRVIDNICQQNGAEFIFFSAPNKNTLYPEYMPYNYVPSDNSSNLENLTAELSDCEFYLDMKSALLGLESPTPLYHKTDTHWNNFGAYAGHTILMNNIGKMPCGTGSSWYIKYDRLGDLAEMIYPSEGAKDMQLHNDYEFKYKYTSRFRGLDDVNITASCENGRGNLLMYRDSYGEAILPYMAEVFETSEFSRAVPYRLTNIQAEDTVIIEIVERNLKNLLEGAPIAIAPECDISVIDGIQPTDAPAVVDKTESGELVNIYGYFPPECISDEGHRIYAVCGDAVYEAFTCFEGDKLEGAEYSPYGFSLYLPKDIVSEDMRIIAVDLDGKAYSAEYKN